MVQHPMQTLERSRQALRIPKSYRLVAACLSNDTKVSLEMCGCDKRGRFTATTWQPISLHCCRRQNIRDLLNSTINEVGGIPKT